MPMPAFPAATLLASKWKSFAKDHDKKLGIGDKLDDLENAYRGLMGEAVFGVVKPDTAAATQKALAEMAAAEKGALKQAIEAAKAASAHAKSKGAELQKKDPPTYKLLAPNLDKIVGDAADWAKAIEKEAAAERAEMEKHFAKLKAQEAKAGEGEGDDKDDANVGKLIAGTTKLLVNEIRKYTPAPGEPSLYKFCMAWAGPKLVVVVRKRSQFSDSFKALLAPQLGVAKVEQGTTGEVTWDEEKKRLVFSCRGKIPAMAKVKVGLKLQLAKNINVVLRKLVRTKDGKEKFEDVAEGAEDDTSGPAPVRDVLAEFNAELNALSPRMMPVVKAGGKAADEVKKLLAQANAAGKAAATAEKGLELLAQIEAIVDKAEEAGGAAAPAPAPAGAPDAAALDKLRKARADWGTVRKAFHDEVADFVKWLDEIYREEPDQAKEIKRAKVELITAANRVTPELEKILDAVLGGATARKADAKRTLGTIKAAITGDKIIQAVDGNERNPGCKVVASMADRLRQLEAALG